MSLGGRQHVATYGKFWQQVSPEEQSGQFDAGTKYVAGQNIPQPKKPFMCEMCYNLLYV